MIPGRIMLLGTLLVLAILINARTACAQFTSAIEGTVADSTGAVVRGATVTIKNEETGATQTVQTQESGAYRFTTLPAASFSVTAAAPGFKTIRQEHVHVEAAETKTINLRLAPGGADVVVEVTGQTPLIETSQGRVSGEIEENKVHDLPLTGRNFYTLVVTTPGVTGLASGGGQAYAQASGDIFNPEFGINLSANGARSESNSFLIDSASIDSSQRNGVTNVNPNAEDVQELRVAANNFSAEYGRNSSALVNIITKQGTNRWHGSVGFYHTNNKLQARNEFQTDPKTGKSLVPVFRRNEGAWSFGGPIRKDHTFFFASMDFLRSGVAFGRATTVLAPEFLNFMQNSSNFSKNISTFVASSFPPTLARTGSIDAGHQAGLVGGSGQPADCTAYGKGNPGAPVFPFRNSSIPIACNLPVIATGNFATSLPRNGTQYTIRVDHTFNASKDRIFGSYNHTDLTQVLFGSPFVYPAFNTLEPTYSMHFALGWVHATKNFVNEFGFATTRPFGTARVNHPEVPGITVQGIEGYQTGWGPNEFVQNNFEWRDVASFTRGTHNLKVGGRVTRERADHESSRVYNRPQFSFNSVFDFASDFPNNEGNIGFDPVSGQHLSKLFSLLRTGSLSAFVQDDWKLRPNFTANLGFRFENFFNPSDAQGEQGICTMSFPNGGATLPARIANGVMKCQKHLFNHSMYNYSPRISFAWDPTKKGKMSVRGGFGIFYDRPSNQLFDGLFSNVPRVGLANANINTPSFQPLFALGATSSPPYNYPFPPGLQTGLDPHGGLLHGRASVIVADPSLKTMYMENWFLGLQRMLAPTVVAEINYIGSQGHHEYARYNLNRFNGDLIQHNGSYTGLQPGFSVIDFAQSNENSHYHGLTAALKKRAGFGLTLDAAYTFGKAIDQSSKHDAPEHAEAYNDSRERGLADFDIRHRFALTALWAVPSPSGTGFANKVFGNWELTGVTILQSGPPFSVLCTASYPTCDYNADGTNMDYPNVPGFGSTRTGLSRTDYLHGIFPCNTSSTGPCLNGVFPRPAAGQQGSLGRNTYHGPGYANTDFSVIKNIRTPWFLGSEGANLEFRAEFFNLFNRVNLVNLNQTGTNNLSSGLFGKAVSAYPARDIQFALRLAF
jgi:hypothetical protein